MKDIDKLKLTDMNDFKIIPQLVEEMFTRYDKEQEKYIYKMLYDLKIDKDILKNQVKEIHRLNNILREYKQLEEQGLLLKLPCKVGTTVYDIRWWDNVTKKVKVGGETYYKTVCKHKVSKSKFSLCDYDDIGKEVFLTKEEAEQELKRLECAE